MGRVSVGVSTGAEGVVTGRVGSCAPDVWPVFWLIVGGVVVEGVPGIFVVGLLLLPFKSYFGPEEPIVELPEVLFEVTLL